MKCAARYVSGYRRGQACPYDATEIIGAPESFFVCGHHARAYVPDVRYPLDWSLTRIRSWQMDNLEALVIRERRP